MDLNKMTDEQKWAELGKQYVLIEQTQNNIALLKQSLSKKVDEKPQEEE